MDEQGRAAPEKVLLGALKIPKEDYLRATDVSRRRFITIGINLKRAVVNTGSGTIVWVSTESQDDNKPLRHNHFWVLYHFFGPLKTQIH